MQGKALASMALLTLSLVGMGCGQSAPSPAGSPSAKAAQSAAGPADWNRVVQDAKKEGALVVAGQAGANVAENLTTGFKRAFPDIQLDFSGENGNVLETKLLTERQAGKYTTDLIIHGPPNLVDMLPSAVFDPLQPILSGPDEDPAKWMSGAFQFSDEAGKYVLLLSVGLASPAIYNKQVVVAADLQSYKDLLDPKWKGKLSMLDPRIPGNAQGLVQFWDLTPALGKDFIKAFFNQGVTLTKDDRQLSDWVGRGQFPVGVAANGFEAIRMREAGVPIEFLSANDLKEGGYLTSSWGSVGVLNKAPHPNAARVYLNWLLSKEGQEALVKASGYASRRQDISTAGLLQATVPRPGAQYVEITKETYIKQRPQVVDYVKSLIGS